MNKYLLISGLLLLSAVSTSYGQLQKTLHQSFEIPDSTRTLLIKFPEMDSWKIVSWAGNSIMTESNIKMYSANKGIFNFFLDKGRYNYMTYEKGDSLLMTGQDPKRDVIKAGDMECSEIVDVRIFIPDAFQEVSPGVWAREIKKRTDQNGKEIVRKKLDREKINVSENLQKEVRPEDEVSDSLSNGVIRPEALPDSIRLNKGND